MRIAVVGPRKYNNYSHVESVINRYTPTMIVSGGAPGVDFCAYTYAVKNGITFVCHPPAKEDKERWGFARAARRRNLRIVGMADFVIAFPTSESKGTRHTIKLAKRLKVPGIIIEV
jgi:predicted Rossmann fold nucleotide-binding protein DprA/Smf involved in DNA uptake